MIPTACPRPTEHLSGSGQSPAFTSPNTSSRAGTCAKSAARTAYPSRVARAKGGKSRSATIASASTRPGDASSSTVSTSRSWTRAACCSTKWRASSKLTTRVKGAADEGLEEDMQESYPVESRRKKRVRMVFSENWELRTHSRLTAPIPAPASSHCWRSTGRFPDRPGRSAPVSRSPRRNAACLRSRCP